MADLNDFYFQQVVQENELDSALTQLEAADLDFAIDTGLAAVALDADTGGIVSGLVVSDVGGLSIEVTQGAAYDDSGRRAAVGSTKSINLTSTGDTSVGQGGTPSGGVSTSPGAGNQRFVSVFLVFERDLQDSRVDGTGTPVFFKRLESFKFTVSQGAAAVSPTDRAPLVTGAILLADVKINNAGDIVEVDITRRQNWLRRVTGAAPTTRVGTGFATRGLDIGGTPRDAIIQLLGYYNDHVDGTADVHPGTNLSFTPAASTWADATGLVATTVEAAINEILTDLGSTSGADKVGVSASGQNWADGSQINSSPKQVQVFLEDIVQDLADTATTTAGTNRIGGEAQTNGVMSVPAGTLRAQIQTILGGINARGLLSGGNTWTTGNQTFEGDVIIGPNATTGDLVANAVKRTPPATTSIAWRYALLAEIEDQSITPRSVRIYWASDVADRDDGIVVTINATWNTSTIMWNQDDASSPSWFYGMQALGEVVHFKPAASGPWADGSWDNRRLYLAQVDTVDQLQYFYETTAVRYFDATTFEISDGTIRFTDVTAVSQSQPDQTTNPTANTLYAKNIVKAWAVCEVNGSGNLTVLRSFNVNKTLSEAANPNTGAQVAIDLYRPLLDTDYTVVVSGQGGTSFTNCKQLFTVAGTAVAQVSFAFIDVQTSIAREDWDALGTKRFSFAVLGRQT